MTAVVTSIDHGTATGATNTNATASVSPTANSTLVLIISNWDGGAVNTPLVSSISGLSLNWRQIGHATMNGTHGDLSVWTAICGASPGSGAITYTTSTNYTAGTCYDLLQVVGGVVVGNSFKSAVSGVATDSVTMATALDTGNRFIFAMGGVLTAGQTVAVTPAATWTELNDQYISSGGVGGVSLETQVSPSSTATAASGVFGGSGINSVCVCVEVGLVTGVQWHQTGVGNRGTGSAAISWNQYVAESDAQTKVLVAINMSISSNNTGATCGVTYDGVAMTQESYIEVGSSTNRAAIGIYSLSNPPTGTKVVTVTPSAGGTTIVTVQGQSVVYSNAGAPINVTNAAATGLTVTTALLGMALCATSNGQTISVASHTVRYTGGASVAGVGDFLRVQDAVGGASSVVFTNTGTASGPVSMGIFLPVYAAPGPASNSGFFGLM